MFIYEKWGGREGAQSVNCGQGARGSLPLSSPLSSLLSALNHLTTQLPAAQLNLMSHTNNLQLSFLLRPSPSYNPTKFPSLSSSSILAPLPLLTLSLCFALQLYCTFGL